MRALGWLLWKDALSEARGFERVVTLLVFGIVVLLTFQFTLPPEAEARPQAAAGFLWATVVFASLLELRRSFESERRDSTLDGLRAAPLDPTLLFVAKFASSFLVVGALTVAVVPLTALFFGASPGGVPAAIGIALAGVVGLLAWGTLFAVISGGSRAGEILLPILLFPLLVPQTIACVRLLAHQLTGTGVEQMATGFLLLGAFDVLALGTSILLFDYVVDE